MWSSEDEEFFDSDDEDQEDDDPDGDQQYSISSHPYQTLEPESNIRLILDEANTKTHGTLLLASES